MEEHLRAKSLRQDTTLMGTEINYLHGIIRLKDSQLSDNQSIIINKDNIISAKNKDFDELSLKYDKQFKNVKRLKQTSLILAITTFVLGIIVYLK